MRPSCSRPSCSFFFAVEKEILSIKEKYQNDGKSAFGQMMDKLPEDNGAQAAPYGVSAGSTPHQITRGAEGF
jgi:hypothetical protein